MDLEKKNSTNIFPVRTEQASSINFLLSRLYFEFPDGTAHLISETRATIRRQICFYYAIFAERLPKFLVRQHGKGFYLTLKCFFWISFQGHKSVKSLRERSVLAVRIAKFGPLREPIRNLLFTLDQFSHIITINSTVLGSSSMTSKQLFTISNLR